MGRQKLAFRMCCYLIFSKNLAAWGSNGKTMMDVNTLKIV